MTVDQKIKGYKKLIKENKEHAGPFSEHLEKLYKSRLRYWQRRKVVA